MRRRACWFWRSPRWRWRRLPASERRLRRRRPRGPARQPDAPARSTSTSSSCSRSTSPIRWIPTSWRCSATATSRRSPRPSSSTRSSSGMHGRVAVTYVEWAGVIDQKIVVPWRLIDGAASAEAVAAEISGRRMRRAYRTSISGALTFSAPLFDGNGFRGIRRVIDVSGDGTNNQGPLVTLVRDEVLAKGITINGLPIMLKRPNPSTMDIPNLDVYYEDCVIGGPGAFVVPIREREKFKEAIRTKLVLEIAGRTPEPRVDSGGRRRAAHLLHDRRTHVAAALGRRSTGSAGSALEARDQLDVGRVAELVDRRDARRAGSRRRRGCCASRAKVAGLHDTATITGTRAGRELARLRLGALARRIEHHRLDARRAPAARADGGTGRAPAAAIGLRPGAAAARLSAAIAGSSVSTAVTRARSASRSANGPTPANRSAIALRACRHARRPGARARPRLPAVACRNAPGGSASGRPADADRRRGALDDQLAVAGEARKPVRLGEARRARRAVRRGQRSRAAHVDVEAGIGRGRLDVERLARPASAPRRSPRRHRSRRRGRARASGSGRSARRRASAAPRSRPPGCRACRAARGTRRAGALRHAHRSGRRPPPQGPPAPAPRRRGRASRRDSDRAAQCCTAQPPQMPKCGQIGAIRSGLGCSTRSEMAPVGMARAPPRPRRSRPAAYRARRPARRRVSATPSPRWPRREMTRRSVTHWVTGPRATL